MDRIELLATVPENYIYSREEEIETIIELTPYGS